MEITLYPKLDPRALTQHYKNMESVAPLLSQAGNDIIIDSKVKSVYEQQIPVYCDNLTLKGKFEINLILHGNCDFKLDDAELFNVKNSYATITVADDFVGNITINNSTIHFKKTQANTAVMQYGIAQNMNRDNLTMPYEINISNSTIDGVILRAKNINLDGDVTLNALDNNRFSVLNGEGFNANSSKITTNFATLVSNNPTSNTLPNLTVTAGPVQLLGDWIIDTITINETGKSADDLVKVGTNNSGAKFELHNLVMSKLRSKNRVLKLINSDVTLTNGHLQKANASVKDSILHIKAIQDQLNWSILGENYLDLDEQSLTNLRMQKDKFTELNLATPKQVPDNDTNLNIPQMPNNEPKNESPSNPVGSSTNKANNNLAKNDDNSDLDEKTNDDVLDAVDPATAAKKLKDLIGLQSVKDALQTYINQAAMNKRRRAMGKHEVKATSRNMAFMGNPGVGKTTVAKLVTGILYENGAIESNKFVFCQVKELIGTHLGETQKATHEKFKQAMGGVLFIDEAHTLINDDLYSQEATKQILQDSENYADKIITILAGYPAEMEDYLENGDPGLKSRFPNKVDFPDYSKKELLQIFKLFMKNDHQLIDPKIYKTKVFAYELLYYAGLTKNSDQPQANARSIRNFYDRLMQLRDNRLVTLQEPTGEDLMTVTSHDFATLYNEIRDRLLKESR